MGRIETSNILQTYPKVMKGQKLNTSTCHQNYTHSVNVMLQKKKKKNYWRPSDGFLNLRKKPTVKYPETGKGSETVT